MEKKLPESPYTKTVNDIFDGSWPYGTLFDRLFWFWISYRWAIKINFLLANYINNNIPNNFLWLTIALFYTLFLQIFPKIRTLTAKWRYLLIFIILTIATISFIYEIKHGLGNLKISIIRG